MIIILRTFLMAFSILALMFTAEGAAEVDQDSVLKESDIKNMSDFKMGAKTFSLHLKSKFRENIDFCNRALRYKPTNAELYYYKGRSHLDLEEYEEALEAFDSAIKYEKEYVGKIYYQRGLTLAAMERYEEALQSHRRALKEGYDSKYVYYEIDGMLLKLGRLGKE